MLEVPEKLDRSAGDIHATGNPHYMVDPENARIVAHHLAEAFGSMDAPNRAFYMKRFNEFEAVLTNKLADWKATLAPYKGQHLVAYHNSWIYFGKRFGLRTEIFLEPKPGIPPSPAHLAKVIAQMKSEGARVILVEPYLNRKTADTVARSTSARVVPVSQYPGALKGTEDGYIALMDYLVNATAEALKGTQAP